MATGVFCRNAVSIAVILNQAGGADTDRLLHIAIKGPAHRAQLGALNPVMENGGGGEHRPWKFDTAPSTQTTDIYRTFTKLHYALVPYLMKHGAAAFSQKRSLMTFIDKVDYSYLLGPDIFVAPMIASGTSRKVAFPAGNDWIYLFDKTKTYVGGSTQTLTIPLDQFPVFLRKGSSIATTLKVP